MAQSQQSLRGCWEGIGPAGALIILILLDLFGIDRDTQASFQHRRPAQELDQV